MPRTAVSETASVQERLLALPAFELRSLPKIGTFLSASNRGRSNVVSGHGKRLSSCDHRRLRVSAMSRRNLSEGWNHSQCARSAAST